MRSQTDPAPAVAASPVEPLSAAVGAAQMVAPQRVGPLARPLALARACRPRQWVKNLLVLAAPGAAGILFYPDVPGKLLVTFVSFCMLASSTYLFNDLHDLGEDRSHPRRGLRPIAAGEVSPALAGAAAVGLLAGGLGLALIVRPWLVAVGAGYVLLTGSYTLWWRSVAVADIAVVAGGFVLRAIAGGVATEVSVSRWFLMVTSFGALFLVAGKRYAELSAATAAEDTARPFGRPTLGAYSERYLQFVIGLSATVAVAAYCLWAFQRSHHAQLTWYELTVIPFVLWLLRYALLIDAGGGEAPEQTALGDGFLLTMSAAWSALFISGVYVFG